MSTGALGPPIVQTILDDAGDPVSGAQIFFYKTGTSTPAAVYHDAALLVPWTIPAVTDSAGRIVFYLDPAGGALKVVVKDGLGVQFGPVVDPYTPTNAGSVGLGEIFVFGSNSAAAVTVTSYPSGATFDTLQPGSSVWLQDSAALSGVYVLEATGVQTVSGTLTVALVNLTSGAPDTPIATCAITSLTGQVVQSSPIVFPGGGVVIEYGIKSKVDSNTGFVLGARITRTA